MTDLVAQLRSVQRNPVGGLCVRAADRIEKLEAALRKIAQHDMQAIAMDALRPGERIRGRGDE